MSEFIQVLSDFFQVFLESSKTYIAVSLPEWLDVASVAVGAVSGVGVARERKLDPVGFVSLAIICGLGGGLIRDVIMQQGGVYMLTSPYAIPTAAIVGLVAYFFPEPFNKWPNLLEWVDIISVGLFVVVGTDKAIVWSLIPVSSILLGTITGVGGGMLRDICMGDVPKIFRPGNYYALCALAGAIVYYACVVWLGMNKYLSAVLCVVVTVTLRRWSLHYNARTTEGVNLGPSVMRRLRSFKKNTEDFSHGYYEEIKESNPFLDGTPPADVIDQDAGEKDTPQEGTNDTTQAS